MKLDITLKSVGGLPLRKECEIQFELCHSLVFIRAGKNPIYVPNWIFERSKINLACMFRSFGHAELCRALKSPNLNPNSNCKSISDFLTVFAV